MGYPERNVPDSNLIVKMDVLEKLAILAEPLAAPKGDINLTTEFELHANPDPAKLMIIWAGSDMDR